MSINLTMFIIHPLMLKGLAYCIYFLSWFLCLWFLLTKNWILFFKSKWTYFTLQLEWQQLINSNKAIYNHQSNWFIRNNNKYGKTKNVLIIFGTIAFVGWLITCYGVILIIWTNKHPMMRTLSISMIVFIFLIVIILYNILVFKTPAANDIFYIHHENRLHATVMFIVVLLYGIMNGIFTTMDHLYVIYSSCVIWPIISLLLTSMIYISTKLVIVKNKDYKDLPLQLANSISKSRTRSQRSNSKRTIHITLEMVLKHKKAFHHFMVHMSREYVYYVYIIYILCITDLHYKFNVSIFQTLIVYTKHMVQSHLLIMHRIIHIMHRIFT